MPSQISLDTVLQEDWPCLNVHAMPNQDKTRLRLVSTHLQGNPPPNEHELVSDEVVEVLPTGRGQRGWQHILGQQCVKRATQNDNSLHFVSVGYLCVARYSLDQSITFSSESTNSFAHDSPENHEKNQFG